MKKTTFVIQLFIFFLGVPLVAQESRLEGHWEGAIVVTAAEQEIDLSVEFNRDKDGRLGGQLWFPTQRPKRHEIASLTVNQAHFAFQVLDENNIPSTFEGDLQSEGSTIVGTLVEGGQVFPLELERTDSLQQDALVQKLSGNLAELQTAFNNDSGHVRLIMMLSPSSVSSKMTLRLVRKYVLGKVSNPDLRIYVIWETPSSPDADSLVKSSASLLVDLRVAHFQAKDRTASEVFKSVLASVGVQYLANPILLFSVTKTWIDAAPKPDRVWQVPKVGSKEQLPPQEIFNAIQLGRDVQSLAGSKSVSLLDRECSSTATATANCHPE
jgi:hypothetical protein